MWEPSTESYKWLEQDLAAVNRTATPWVVIAGHRTMYTSDVHWTRVKESWKMQVDPCPRGRVFGCSCSAKMLEVGRPNKHELSEGAGESFGRPTLFNTATHQATGL